MTLKEKFLSDKVEAKSVRDFLERYYKLERLHDLDDPRKADRLVTVYEAELREDGYCIISRHDSVTGKVVAFFGAAEGEVEMARRIA